MIFILAFIVMFIPVVVFRPTKILHKENLPKKKQKAIITSNHYSNWDPLLFDGFCGRKFIFLTKKELFKNKLIGFILKGIGAIPVDRDNMSLATYKAVINELNKNHQVFIFPEGTRNKLGSKELLEIKSGFLTFASKADCDIIPTLIYQKSRFLKRNYIIIGKPFKLIGDNPKRLTKEELEENLERYLLVLADLRKELDEYVEGKKKRNKR